jgi:hypothetical protein
MASRGTTFAKLDRERARKAKAAEKREKRISRGSETTDDPPEVPTIAPGEELSAAALLQLVEDLHKAFADKRISFEDFEERKAELMARISVV